MYLLVALLFWLFSFQQAAAQYTVWDAPAVYYDFEIPNSTVVKDKSGNNNITIYGSGVSLPVTDIGKPGSGLKFNGINNYAMAPDSTEFSQTGSFSIEAWVKFSAVSNVSGTIQTVLGKWDETTDIRSYRLTVETDSTGRNFPKFQVSTDGTAANIKTVAGQTQILPNQWYLLQGYYNASLGTIYIYVNGVREGTTASVGGALADTASNFYLATTKTGASTYSNFLNGTVDEVRLTTGTRNDGSLAYSQERGKPVVKLNFDDGSGYQTMNKAPNYSRAALINFSGNSQWIAGVKNYALQLTSANSQYVDLGSNSKFQLGGSITLSAWIYVTSLGNYAIISQPNTGGYTFQLTSGGELLFGNLGGTTVNSSGAGVQANTWTHVAVSYDGTNAYFYKNARLISSPALALWSVTPGAVLVGKAGTTPNYFNGKIDQVMIYPYNRTLFEISADFSGGAITLGKNYSLQASNAQMACPAGFVPVVGDPLYGTKDFCVMKYNAKCDDNSDGIGNITQDTGYNTWPNSSYPCNTGGRQIVSSAAGYPIANVAQSNGSGYDAKALCSGRGWHLITNNEYMTIVRNLEKMGSNWCDSNGGNCGFTPGQSGKIIASGHNDNGPALALQASTDDSQGCYGTVTKDVNTACGSGGTQKRTLTLSNGETIWDMAGNVWEWTDNTVLRKDEPDSATSGTPDVGWGWTDFASGSTTRILVNNGQNTSMGYDAIRPSNIAWNANQGVGRIYTYSDVSDASSTVYAFLRGGSWNDGSYAGAWTLFLYHTPGVSSAIIGFRCVAPLQ
ncbi:MAG: hypothetical protein PHQ01_02400 [Candidatus Pacebacteria bacterium]|nr:hypothetical protein [Candidatus Paceibacterota bacterium]